MGASLWGKAKEDPVKVAAANAINAALSNIRSLYAECEEIAIAHGISFTYSGPSGYGDGGGFDPERLDEEKEYDWEDDPTGWRASSQSC
jgi:hypothetical protein